MHCQLISLSHTDFYIELLLSDCLYVSCCLFKYIPGLVTEDQIESDGDRDLGPDEYSDDNL
jgi:hypothetical protein